MTPICEMPHRRAGRPDEPALLLAAQAHDGPGRAELVEAYMPLIGSVAHRYRGARAVNHSELMQEGIVGLLRAVDRYDPGRETPFWAYASFWVRQAMQQLVAELTWPVVLSDRALRQLARIRAAERRFAQDEGRSPSVSELGAAAGLGPEHLGLLLAAERSPRGFDEPVVADRGAGSALGEMLSDPAAEDPFDRIPSRDAADRLCEVFDVLSERERMVVTEHYGLHGEPRTLRTIAAELSVSAERVRQIEQGALDKLRDSCDAGC
ncbi:sigma-70 family RNA polymerase sigma factor [Conexibacter woesei]|uniref:sigma-70 family RNA polymerase sigma factor n=1 Tax=Conexibacter woesei TaxID=191495 RepID=UPI000426568A|nr:sigma-70 family RNA polymerase sigma factor [Conexibacter woesei]